MSLTRTLTFIFEDRQWVGKITIITVFSFLSLSSIFVVGIAALSVGLGFMIQLAGNVRNGHPRPLPEWDDYIEKITLGGQVLGAILAYNIPLILIGGCSSILMRGLGGGLFGQSIALVTICCTLPFLLIYTLFAWPMLATALAEFIETKQSHSMFRPTHLWDLMLTHRESVLSWSLYAFIVNLGLLILLLIPCIGWLAILMFAFPVHGHLLGQYAHHIHIAHPARKKAKHQTG